jgi:hypothetical protein
VQQVKIAFAPVSRHETKPSDEGKQQDEDDQSRPVDVLHRAPPSPFWRAVSRLFAHFTLQLQNARLRKHGADDDPKQLIPVEERHADPLGSTLL